MPFPWARYWRYVGVVFVAALVLTLVLSLLIAGGRLGGETLLIAVVDSAVLAVVISFPLTQRVYRGPRQ